MQRRPTYFIEKIEGTFGQKQEDMNARIYIDDYIATAVEHDLSYGEYFDDEININIRPNTLDRLFLHIKSLAKFANIMHAINHCELKTPDYEAVKSIGKLAQHFAKKHRCYTTYNFNVITNAYKIKENHLNHITRVSLPEFSLYPDEPLYMDQYHQLVSKITKIASQMLDNTHLVISSIPVISSTISLDENKKVVIRKKLLNVTLYVQGGKEPVITPCVKTKPHSKDLKYNNLENFSQQEPIIKNIYDTTVSSCIADQHGTVINSQNVFIVKTKGGAQYIQAIDICLEYWFNHARELLRKMLDIPLNNTYLIPNQVNHLLTANYMDTTLPNNNISQNITFVDAVYQTTLDRNYAKDKIDIDVKDPVIKQYLNYNAKTPLSLSLTNEKDAYLVSDPIFGHDYYITPIQEKILDRLSKTPEFSDLYKIRNANAIQAMVREVTGTNDEAFRSNIEKHFKRMEAEGISTTFTQHLVLNKFKEADQLIECFILLKELSLLTDKNALFVFTVIQDNILTWLTTFDKFLEDHHNKIDNPVRLKEIFFRIMQEVAYLEFFDDNHLNMLFHMDPKETIAILKCLHQYAVLHALNKIIFNSFCENPKRRDEINDCFSQLEDYNLLTEPNCQLVQKSDFDIEIVEELSKLNNELADLIKSCEIRLSSMTTLSDSPSLFRHNLRVDLGNCLCLAREIQSRLVGYHFPLSPNLVALLAEPLFRDIYADHEDLLIMMGIVTQPHQILIVALNNLCQNDHRGFTTLWASIFYPKVSCKNMLCANGSTPAPF